MFQLSIHAIYSIEWILLSNFRCYCWLNLWVNPSTMSENESKQRLSVPSPKFMSGKIPAWPSLGVFELDLDKLWTKYEIQMIQKIQRDMVIRLLLQCTTYLDCRCDHRPEMFLNAFSFESTAKEWMHSFGCKVLMKKSPRKPGIPGFESSTTELKSAIITQPLFLSLYNSSIRFAARRLGTWNVRERPYRMSDFWVGRYVKENRT